MATNILLRVWTGIVAAVAGASLALLFQIVGIMTFQLPVDYLMGLVTAFAGLGFVLGVIVGPRTKKTITDEASQS